MNTEIMNTEQETELKRLKAYFPFRIVWGFIDDQGELQCHANHTRHKLNKVLRSGKKVWTV